ncbi:uncharacterized protein Z518_07973 [Rhinocladiella mackenziei CBS 650.93]|uniref:3-beta hydroxysteroid dehydrogenase/isomerase domain-containing protein n=1 Tax=Rhinocladiella mackenziei CBS 650.93 TaxID=1442369 RepID=A0A0D2I872_9EURO|nr:uncharacterized protein Z518_07973 [Rhinocladiella mackenziei CBS 650.93]KIX02034.1 hypothetical protein Z518_07973 [Rhinocladiella mackenziei CBS 650.93]
MVGQPSRRSQTWQCLTRCDEAASRADVVIHIVTPLAYTDLTEKLVKPSWAMVHNILNAAGRSSRVKRVIITGSTVSTFRIPDDVMSGKSFSADVWNCIPFEEAETDAVNAYQYSKPRGFDLVSLFAPSIIEYRPQEEFKPLKTSLGGQAKIHGIYLSLLCAG